MKNIMIFLILLLCISKVEAQSISKVEAQIYPKHVFYIGNGKTWFDNWRGRDMADVLGGDEDKTTQVIQDIGYTFFITRSIGMGFKYGDTAQTIDMYIYNRF